MLSAQGWNVNTGLGASGQGIVKAISASKKFDSKGIGANATTENQSWTGGGDFGDILKRLNNSNFGSEQSNSTDKHEKKAKKTKKTKLQRDASKSSNSSSSTSGEEDAAEASSSSSSESDSYQSKATKMKKKVALERTGLLTGSVAENISVAATDITHRPGETLAPQVPIAKKPIRNAYVLFPFIGMRISKCGC